MARFEIKIPGSLYSLWPSGEEITLIDCYFAAGNADREFMVSTEVDVESEEEARRVGREKCQDATNLLELCIGAPLNLHEKGEQVRGERGTVSFSNAHTRFSIVNAPLAKEQLEAAAKAQSAIQAEQDPEKKEALFRAIHWQALARWETKSKIDRFIKFWIALEVLVEGEGRKLVPKGSHPLQELYPHYLPEQIKDVVGRIYGVRADIVHFGVRKPQELEEKLKQLEDILSDLIRQRLGLEFRALAKKHFEEVGFL